MLVSGVLFGDFAAIIYWFPKIFGFRLNERLWKISFWLWTAGFLGVFVPLYILGFLGVTRRTSDYLASTGWQPMFILAGLGSLVLAAGVIVSIFAFIVSVRHRARSNDLTGDPWDGRTLEWSTTSPPPPYVFAVVPVVEERDAFWTSKQTSSGDTPPEGYMDIRMPKNTSTGALVGATAFLLAFGMVWHIYWLSAVTLFIVVTLVAIRTTTTDANEKVIPAAEVASIERSARERRLSA